MLRTIAALLLIVCASRAGAQGCPDFYRFVDFGLKDRNGIVYRGGPVFRAESLGGEPLLVRDGTDCLEIRDIARDGHGNPIPVVTRIAYDPGKAGIDLISLAVSVVQDAAAAAEENAEAHRARIGRAETGITKGADFLCASTTAPDEMTCQLASPFPGNAPLVVYCDATSCRMPVLAIHESLSASAEWASGTAFLGDPLGAGAGLSERVRQIHAFLVPLSAAL